MTYTTQTEATAVVNEQVALDAHDMKVIAMRSPGLGNSSYLVVAYGDALVIDPQRDIDRYVDAALRHRARIRYVLETHVHSDFVSGALALARAAHAEVVAPARGRYAFKHRAVDDGDSVEMAGAEIQAIATPGHTFDHVSWRLDCAAGEGAIGVFTGGSLLHGGAGRTDLLGEKDVAALTSHQFASLRRLAQLPSSALVMPTHGGGSTCSATESVADGFGTIASELASNPYIAASDVADLESRLAPSRGPVPAYFQHVARINRQGPTGLGRPEWPEGLTPGPFARLAAFGAAVVDTRDRWTFADGHIRGSLNVEPYDRFSDHLGSVVPFGTPLALVVAEEDRPLLADLVTAAFRVGYRVDAVLEPGIDAWQGAGFDLESYPAIDALELVRETSTGSALPAIVHVRDPAEWRDGVLPVSHTISLRGLVARAHELRDLLSGHANGEPVAVACRGGARAAVAASYLARLGIPVRAVLGGGIPDALVPALAYASVDR